jgi:hypothetical protein
MKLQQGHFVLIASCAQAPGSSAFWIAVVESFSDPFFLGVAAPFNTRQRAKHDARVSDHPIRENRRVVSAGINP